MNATEIIGSNHNRFRDPEALLETIENDHESPPSVVIEFVDGQSVEGESDSSRLMPEDFPSFELFNRELKTSRISSMTATTAAELASQNSTLSGRRNSRARMRSLQNHSETGPHALKVKNIDLVGREKEINILQSCLQRITREETTHGSSSVHKELVFIKGYSGMGKSSLAKTVTKHSKESQTKALFTEGKFDLNTIDAAYSGIAKAYGKVCQIIKSAPDDTVQRIGKAIEKELNTEAEFLIHLIPEFEDLVPNIGSDESENKNLHRTYGIEHGIEQWKYAFRSLTRILSGEFAPLILLLDDLQWADMSSLDLLDSLISDVQNPNPLMIIGCYRSNDVDENSFLHNKIQTLKEKRENCQFNLTEIEIAGYGVGDVNRMIMSMMASFEEEQTRPLAELCFKRTLGNPFFVIQFMSMLDRENLLMFNKDILEWEWDISVIDIATISTANVIDLLQTRMKKLPQPVQLLLQFAACLGSSFRKSSIEIIWKKLAVGFSGDDVRELINTACANNFIEAAGHHSYSWAHDNDQEAALSLSNIVNASLKFEIGITLFYGLDEKGLEEELFTVADLVNSGGSVRRPEFADLNFRAAEMARRVSAFQSGSQYVANGIKMLPKDKWIVQRDLTLKLYTLGTELEFALGNLEIAEYYSREVLELASVTLLEAFPLKLAKARQLCSVDLNFKAAIDYCLGLLKELGCHLVWTKSMLPAQATIKLFRTIKRAKAAPLLEDCQRSLKSMTDPRLLAICRVLSSIGYAAINEGESLLCVLAVCKLVEITLKHGFSDSSPLSMSSLGLMVIQVQQDFATGKRFAEIALSMQTVVGSARLGQCTYEAYLWNLAWVRPLDSCLAPLLEGYTAARRLGESESAMWCLVGHCIFVPYVMGRSLQAILAECPRLLSEIEELVQPEQEIVVTIFWQAMEILGAKSLPRAVGKLEGDIFSASSFTGKSNYHIGSILLMETDLLLFMDLETAAEMALKFGDQYEKICFHFFTLMNEVCHRAIPLHVMARKTKKRKYVIEAKRLRSRIEKWSKAGNPNVKHCEMLLKAEQAAMDKKNRKADELYRSAIVSASHSGYLHHTALFNELYADYLQEHHRDEAKRHVDEAIRYYGRWGALWKVNQLRKFHGVA